jgi:hypothetical protein
MLKKVLFVCHVGRLLAIAQIWLTHHAFIILFGGEPTCGMYFHIHFSISPHLHMLITIFTAHFPNISVQFSLVSDVYIAVHNMAGVVLWLRIALAKGSNRVSVSIHSIEDGNRFSFQNIVFLSLWNTGWWIKSRIPVILSVIHHCQNPLEAAYFW